MNASTIMRKLDAVESELASANAELKLVIQQLKDEFDVTPKEGKALLTKLEQQVRKRETQLELKFEEFDERFKTATEDD